MTTECLTRLVGIKELCTADTATPFFWLDDAEGVDRMALSQVAKSSLPSGKAWGNDLIDAAARFLLTDIETLIPKGYTIKSSLNSFCNNCTYTSISSSSAQTGVVIKNISGSTNAYLSIDSLKVMLNSTGTYHIVLDDGIEAKIIEAAFTSGVEKVIININFKTTAASVKIYMQEAGVNVAALSCPTVKSCGCSKSSQTSKDIEVKGLLSGAEFTTQYGFIPCASVVCSMDSVMCLVVNQQPRLFAVALLYRAASKYFSEFSVTQRNNSNASFNKEDKKELADYYSALYYERLNGSQNIKGIRDNLAAALNNINDVCVDCKRQTGTMWAIS